MSSHWVGIVEVFFLVYFALINFYYLFLNTVALFGVIKSSSLRDIEKLPKISFGFEPPVSILIPAFNEENGIIDTVHGQLQINYPEYEIIVINDGSTDKTFEKLQQTFELEVITPYFRDVIPCKNIRAVYASKNYPKLRVIDKENGGRADALNAAINLAKSPIFCTIDADSILSPNSLYLIIQAFLDNPFTIVAGGFVRPANGCDFKDGFLTRVGFPTSWLASFQVVEYLRAFFFSRLALSELSAIMVMSGAFSTFSREAVVNVGGFRTDNVTEDFELILRLHVFYQSKKIPYCMKFIPDPVCWTEVPEDFTSLKNQRIRWHRGLSQTIFKNLKLLFYPGSRWIGWFSYPALIFFEWLEPVVQLLGLVFTVITYLLGLLSHEAAMVFLFLTLVMGTLQSANALILEESFYHTFTRPRDLLKIFTITLVEHFGYR